MSGQTYESESKALLELMAKKQKELEDQRDTSIKGLDIYEEEDRKLRKEFVDKVRALRKKYGIKVDIEN